MTSLNGGQRRSRISTTCQCLLLSAAALPGTSGSAMAAEAASAAASSRPSVSTPTRPADTRRSGRDDMGEQTRAMQDDDGQNPGLLWLQAGQALWRKRADPAARSCADCHGEARQTMRGVAPRYPVFDTAGQAPITLGRRIDQCRVQRQGLPSLPTESDELLSLETLVANASRGMPITPDADPRLAPFTARGEQRYRQRVGQLNLSCAQCHDDHAGGKLGGTPIPQGHPTGYPLYRLEWQALGSLQRRLRNCLTGVRAEPFADGAVEWAELDLYLKRRASGMPMETPAVRP